MKLQLIALIFGVLCVGQNQAQQLTLKADAPAQYQVKAGDTLWDIAGLYLAKPLLWPELWQANPAVKNPDLIYPGDLLLLRLDQQGRAALEKSASEPPLTSVIDGRSASGQQVIKLRPRIRQLRSDSALGLLPAAAIQPFLTGHRLLTDSELLHAAYVLGAAVPVKHAVSGHILYIKGELDPAQHYVVYRRAEQINDPKTGEELGVELVPLARLKLLAAADAQQAGIQRAELIESRQEVRQGDLVLPEREQAALPATFDTAPAMSNRTGQILSSASKLREFTRWEVVLTNLGTAQGVQVGQVWPVYRQSPAVLDGARPQYPQDSDAWDRTAGALFQQTEMPFEVVGQVLVLEAQANASFVIVVEALQPLRLGDRIGGQDASQQSSKITGNSGAMRP